MEIYQRSDESPRWYAKLRIGRQLTKRPSLGTTDRVEAERIALDLYQELEYKHGKGLSLSRNSFTRVATDYLANYKNKVDMRASLPPTKQSNLRKYSPNQLQKKSDIIEKFLIPFFGNKHVQEITDQDIIDYIDYREAYWSTGDRAHHASITYKRGSKTVTRPKRDAEKGPPSHSTINKDLTALRAIFHFAKQKKLISKSEIPEIENVTAPDGYDDDHTTPSFTEEELKQLLETIARKHEFQTNPKHKLAHKRLALYIAIMATSGMRTSEVMRLTFNDCRVFKKKDQEHFSLSVGSKNKRRELIPLAQCRLFIEKLKEYHRTNAKNYGWTYSDDMYVFSNEKGAKISSFAKALDAVLEECGLLYTKDGRKRSSRSFRSYYITTALLHGTMTIEQLAGNVGNSPDVIWRHYNRMKSAHIPEKFAFESIFTRLGDN